MSSIAIAIEQALEIERAPPPRPLPPPQPPPPPPPQRACGGGVLRGGEEPTSPHSHERFLPSPRRHIHDTITRRAHRVQWRQARARVTTRVICRRRRRRRRRHCHRACGNHARVITPPQEQEACVTTRNTDLSRRRSRRRSLHRRHRCRHRRRHC